MPISMGSRARSHVVVGCTSQPVSTSLTNLDLSGRAVCRSSPSEDERAYRKLTTQRDDLHQRIHQKTCAQAQFERSILRFYYDRSICCEKELSQILSLNPFSEPGPPLKCVKTEDRSNGPSPSPAYSLGVAAKVPYLGRSEVSQRVCELHSQEERQAKELVEYEAAIVRMEDEYERTVIHGTLAEQQEAVHRAQSERGELKAELERQRQTEQGLVSLINKLEQELQDLRREKDNSAIRKAGLEEKKRYQMENLDNTRRELQQAHVNVLEAHKELERRKAIIKSLQSQIEEHSLRLKRRKLA